MTAYDIDFTEVRKQDVMFKKRVPVWSGQEVLDFSMNKNKSKIILGQMNQTRVWPKGLFNYVKKFRSFLKRIVRLSIFDNFLTGCVLVNTVVMAMDSYEITPEKFQTLDDMNTVFTWIFIVELSLKLGARGLKKYCSEVMNLLDGAVVMLSIIEMAMAAASGGGSGGNLQAFRTVRVFRTFRVLRVTRILRALKSMAIVMEVIKKSFMDFILITILMFVFIFIYTLLGRQVFQGTFTLNPGEDLPRSNFESFSVAFVTVFQVLTMENWQQVLYATMRASEGSMANKTITAIFFISWIFIGNFILLNLFLAILLDAFAEAYAENEDEDDNLDEEALAKKAVEAAKKLQAEKDKRMRKLGTSSAQLKRLKTTLQVSVVPSPSKKKKEKVRANFLGQNRLREQDLGDIEDMDEEQIRKFLIEKKILKPRAEDKVDNKLVGPEIHANNSIYLFHRDGVFRRNIHFIQKHGYFDGFIMLLIALSSVKLAMESYIVDYPEDHQIVKIGAEIDFIVNYLFFIECVFKIIALGFSMDEGSYLRDSWNRLDFFIVTTSIIDMMLTNTDIPALKVLRMLRMIRPLRVISHNPELKMIVMALFKSVTPVVNVSFVVLIVWLMFAIYGMNTYMGMMFYCSEQPYKYNTKWVCEDHGADWMKFDSNFDNISESMMTLFIVASLEGWPDIMYQAIDVTRKDNGPKKEGSPANSGFFIIFILIGSFFFLNFFTGVLFIEYEQAKKLDEAGTDHKMRKWNELQRMIVKAGVPHELRYMPLLGTIRYRCWQLVNSNPFDVGIMACIVLNMFQMAFDHEGASPSMVNFLKVTNYFFTTVFLLETILKLYVYRMPYFLTAWNKFDFFVVASSLVDLGLELAIPVPDGGQEDSGSQILSVLPQLARVLRVLRVSRVLRLAKKAEKLQKLLKTIIMSVGSLINVFILLMLIFFIMAVLANTMFAQVKSGDVISEYKNFTTFHQSFSLLFSISTGEDWNRVMYDTMRLPEDGCIPDETCGSSIAPIFFLTFNMIVSQIMLNLFILVIIQQFDKYYLTADNPLSCFEDDFVHFKNAWELFTGSYQCVRMKIKNVHKFFDKLPTEMRRKIGVKEDNAKEEEINRIILKMGINMDDGFIYFNEMLYRIMRAQYVTHAQTKMNRLMIITELVTQFQLAGITQKNKIDLNGAIEGQKSKMNAHDFESAFFKTFNAKPVNLFLTKMFYRASFTAWRKFVRNIVERNTFDKREAKEQLRQEQLGNKYEVCAFRGDVIKMEEVPIEVEQEVWLEMDSDDEDAIDSKTELSKGTHNRMFSVKDSVKDSPEVFRQRAKLRMTSNNKKFDLQTIAMSNYGLIDTSEAKESTRGKKSLLLAHTPQQEEVSKDLLFVDPNSMEYTNAVLEEKFNRLEKHKKQPASALELEPTLYSSKKGVKEYDGLYSSQRIKAEVVKESLKQKKKVPQKLNSPLKSFARKKTSQ